MIKIEAITLEQAYSDAASELGCSVTELNIEVVQYPSSGLLGLFRKKAIIVATKKVAQTLQDETPYQTKEPKEELTVAQKLDNNEEEQEEVEEESYTTTPPSFVSSQDELNDEDEKLDQEEVVTTITNEVVGQIKEELDALFASICFELDEIKVELYDPHTLYVELNGADAALLIGKEGYRYKALSYMIFNWINAKYDLQLRLEIAEFLKNQEEAVNRYLESVKENVDRDGRAQTKILDGVLVQIALRELRATYPDKYVAIRTTRDGLKYIIINDYNY